ncbi:MAG: helix-turn-helix transcriptional regulator [Oscillospiraceae bacterium]
MLSENIKTARKSKGLSQEELAVKLNVVRQTISKWEQGLSVPDSDMLIALSDALATPVSALLGEFAVRAEADDLKAIAEKLEIINLQLARQKAARRKTLRWLLIALCAVTVIIAAALVLLNSPYLGWNYSDPETAVAGAAFHAFEWLFVRLAPIILISTVIGIVLTRNEA